MNAELFGHEDAHLLGEAATHPIAQPCGALAALLVVAGVQPAASSRLARAPQCSALGRAQLRFLGSLMVNGSSNKAIAKKLLIAENTVRVHVSAVLDYFESHNRTSAVNTVREQGLVR